MQKSSLLIPIAIVIAAGIIGAAIYVTGRSNAPTTPSDTDTDKIAGDAIVEPVTGADHIRGNPNAPIVLIEYSDYECPFCKQFHNTMNQIMTDYGTDGSVAWVYRQFPLEQLHPNAPKIAAASECVAELGGNDAFWTFTDLIFSERETNDLTDMTRIPEFAETAGVDNGQFELCFNSGKYDEQITDDVQAAIAAGGTGTPYTVVLVGDKQVGTIPGALPYASVKQNIDNLLKQINAADTSS